jgi:hypothetical protein
MKKPRILLVDDDVGITRTVGLYLQENGNCDVRIENVGVRFVSCVPRPYSPDC